MRGVRLSARKKKSLEDSDEITSALSIKCITDIDVKTVIYGEEFNQGEKRTFKDIFERDTSSKQQLRRNSSFRTFSKETLKKEIEKEIGIDIGLNKRQSLRNTPSSIKKRGIYKTVTEDLESDEEDNFSTKEGSADKCKKINKRLSRQNTPKSVKKRGIKNKVVEEVDSEKEDNLDKEPCEKPHGLCDDDDVAGNEMCSFRTPKKRQGMYKKALESAGKISNSGTPNKLRTPSRPQTPLSTSKLSNVLTPKKRTSTVKRTPSLVLASNKSTPLRKDETNAVTVLPAKTPYNLRTKTKKDIQAHLRSLETVDNNEDSDYRSSDDSASESEDTDASTEKEDSSSSDSGKGSEEPKPQCRRSLRFHTVPSKKKCKDVNYVFTADEYFERQGGKCKTSDRRLSRLQTPRLDSSALQDLLSHCSESHSHILAERRCNDDALFDRWMFALSQGFSILTYGLGSKYKILQNFHRTMLSESHVLVVNGFFPSLNIKEIVEMIARDLLGLKQILPSSHTIIDWIESRRHMPHVFLIIHNIDAEPLRSDKTQSILSRLASLPKVHLVASVDHINCPLLWDQAKLSGFNFMWEDTTSFLPYQEETSYETSLMVQNSGSLALSSLLNVYRSLTHNSRGVFRILLEKHLEENSQKYLGMAFSALYKKCRDEMLVTNDLTLRTILTEFLDHQMVKWRRDSEHLYIPVESGVLQQFHKAIQDS